MRKEIIKEGKTVEDAVSLGAKELGLTVSAVTYEVLRAPKKGFLGFGAVDAQVRVTGEVADTPKPQKQAAGKNEPRQRKPEQKNARNSGSFPKEPASSGADASRREEPVTPAPKVPKATLSKSDEAAVSFLRGIISDMGLKADVSAFEYQCDEGGTLLEIRGEDAGILIGHHGETLDALQCLAGLVANRDEEDDDDSGYSKIAIDIEDYRAKREAVLRKLAKRTALRVLKSGKNITLEPMNPYERRIIHSEIQSVEGVSTNSIGSDNNRRIVVYPTGSAKPTEEHDLRNHDRHGRGSDRNGRRRDSEGNSEDRSGARNDRGGRGGYGNRRGGGSGGRPERDPNRPRQEHPVMVEAPDGTAVERKPEPEAPQKPASSGKPGLRPYYMKPKSSTISRPYQKPVKKDSVESYFFDLENSKEGLTREKDEPSEIAKACGIYEDEPEENTNN
ncbi:MAG: Jag N-terminal domain-containing protein [Clostridia bacterium]|nr:Jag N-terminal domain-containing protein [Clostridia bacterium]